MNAQKCILISSLILIANAQVPPLSDWSADWQSISLCSHSPPSEEQQQLQQQDDPMKCSTYKDSDHCSHMRCCWASVDANQNGGVCYPTVAVPASLEGFDASEYDFFAGDQTPPGINNGLGAYQIGLGANDLLSVTSWNVAGIKGANCMGGAGCDVSGVPDNLKFGDWGEWVVKKFLWAPHGIEREGGVGDDVRVKTRVRMGHQQPTILFELTVFNDDEVETLQMPDSITMDFPMLMKYYDSYGWEWGHPSPSWCSSSDVASVETTLVSGGMLKTCEKEKNNIVLLTECVSDDAEDANLQKWEFDTPRAATVIKSLYADDICLTNSTKDPMGVTTCDVDELQNYDSISFTFDESTNQIKIASEATDNMQCLDVNGGFGPNVIHYNCHSEGDKDIDHQQFRYENERIISSSSHFSNSTDMCLTLIEASVPRACTGVAFSSDNDECTISYSGEGEGVAQGTCDLTGVLVPPGGNHTMSLLLRASMADNQAEMLESLSAAAGNFRGAWEDAVEDLEKWWADAFRPDNEQFSGHLPTLVTEDEQLKRSYYGGIYSFLQSGHKKYGGDKSKDDADQADDDYDQRLVYNAVGPDAGISALYMWDTGYTADLWSMLDPDKFTSVVDLFLKLDRSSFNVLDMYTSQGGGKYYAFSDYATYLAVMSLARQSGLDYVKRIVPGTSESIISHMDFLARTWSSGSNPRTSILSPGLVSYGDDSDGFLECVPSYIHAVAGLQAANAYMARTSGEVWGAMGEEERKGELTEMHDLALNATIGLYEDGKGFFNTQYPNGTKIEVRTVVDFISVSASIYLELLGDPSGDGAVVAKEMLDFVRTELLTPGWMRALSMSDPAAELSDRADHGPAGAWNGWLGLTATSFGRFGDYEGALSILKVVGEVLGEGPYGQAVRVYGPDNVNMLSKPMKGGDQAPLAVCGGTIPISIIDTLFGFTPQIFPDKKDSGAHSQSDYSSLLENPDVDRGFDGQLLNVPYQGQTFNIQSVKGEGLTITKVA